MRFSREYDPAIVERQFATLAAQEIDFEQALASGKTVVTCGRIGSDLDFEIQGVSVE